MEFLAPFFLVIVLQAVLVAALIQLEPYHTVRMPVVILALIWGLISFTLAHWILGNPLLDTIADRFMMTVFIAPVVEEGLKSLFLLIAYVFVLVRYTGDAMIYGFTVGSGFAILDNILYLFAGLVVEYIETDTVTFANFIGNAVLRSATTGLIHASIGAVTFTAISAMIYYKPLRAFGVAVLVVAGAILAHAAYNYSLWLEDESITVVASLIVSTLALLTVIGLLNFNGRNEDHQILEELQYDPVHPLPPGQDDTGQPIDPLAQIQERFGRKQARLVQDYLLKQGQIALYAERLDNGDHRPAAVRSLRRAIHSEQSRAKRILSRMSADVQGWMRQNGLIDAAPTSRL